MLRNGGNGVLICSAAGGDDCVPRSGDLVVRSQGGDGEGG